MLYPSDIMATFLQKKRPMCLERREMVEMKYALAGIVIFVLSSYPLGSTFNAETRTQASTPGSIRGAVVVELFTSEGCSTCPPADALLAQLEDEQFIDGAEVIALEEHVDYWNQQGWTDPFSAVEWTLRQQEYAAAFKVDGVYTPQMIVDGRSQFIGSRIREATAGIGRSRLATPPCSAGRSCGPKAPR